MEVAAVEIFVAVMLAVLTLDVAGELFAEDTFALIAGALELAVETLVLAVETLVPAVESFVVDVETFVAVVETFIFGVDTFVVAVVDPPLTFLALEPLGLDVVVVVAEVTVGVVVTIVTTV